MDKNIQREDCVCGISVGAMYVVENTCRRILKGQDFSEYGMQKWVKLAEKYAMLAIESMKNPLTDFESNLCTAKLDALVEMISEANGLQPSDFTTYYDAHECTVQYTGESCAFFESGEYL